MIKQLATSALIMLALANSQFTKAATPLIDKSIFDDGYPEQAPTESLTLSFKRLGVNKFKLDGVDTTTYVDFTNRLDKIGKQLKLNFSYSHSPALISRVSHLKVYFNDNLITVMPIKDQETQISQLKSHSLDLNPKLIKDFNQIRFELVGYYDLICQDDFSKTIWTELSQNSSITLEQQSLALESLLEYFPAPFFDERDYTQLSLPFIFANNPDENTLEAAATLSSWFGAQADWRKATFPVQFNQTPTAHSVVLATNTNKPDFLLDYPDVSKPTVEIISSPTQRYAKVLLILGKDTKQLKDAVVGLAFGHKVMTGRTASINKINHLPLRDAYDAPRWVRSDRAVTFDEFIEYPTQLQTQGLKGQPVNLNLRFAPDLFTWRKEGIPIDLHYRNAPAEDALLSRLNMLINGKFINGFELKSHDEKTVENESFAPLVSQQGTAHNEQDFDITGLDLSKKNKLTYDFKFGVVKVGECSAVPAGGEYGVIDGSSTIDVSGFEHYIALPDLNVFANSGFPFTKFADLDQTTLIMQKESSAQAIQLLLNFTGHLGEITGYPTHRLDIEFPDPTLVLDDKDLIVIAKPNAFTTELPQDTAISVLLETNQRIVEQAIYNGAYDNNNTQKVKVSIESQGKLGIIAGFQSPFNSERSVVSMTATTDNAFTLLSDALIKDESTALIKGSAAIINNAGIKTINTDDQYFVGYVPIHTLIWFHFSDHPFILALLSILVLLLISFLLWRLLGVLTQKRLSEGDE